MKTLNTLKDLKESGFGSPPPRHGLALLHWFSTGYVRFVTEHVVVYCKRKGVLCDPRRGEFGFHPFENKPLYDGSRLLPVSYQPYYIVGNLNRPGSQSLPEYVDERYTGQLDDSNTDRIIISLSLDRIYVTEHLDQKNFDPRATYRVSNLLLNIISRRDSDSFLSEMGYDEGPTETLYYYNSQLINTNVVHPAPVRNPVVQKPSVLLNPNSSGRNHINIVHPAPVTNPAVQKPSVLLNPNSSGRNHINIVHPAPVTNPVVQKPSVLLNPNSSGRNHINILHPAPVRIPAIRKPPAPPNNINIVHPALVTNPVVQKPSVLLNPNSSGRNQINMLHPAPVRNPAVWKPSSPLNPNSSAERTATNKTKQGPDPIRIDMPEDLEPAERSRGVCDYCTIL